ncbi:hypothetical protein Mkiyose1665_20820 [Mycobacterium kiyosense]|uniref:Uncharacterized protein n=1 Tax=Mycobacterium kiyosense TaxID=2871094 RepID=A0A9P3Q8F6_9MYCO|nr:hypothetical protein IWGMT90018_01570 [Mycobacterium kiyosense]BDE11567.1 hypothetical protein MKCMC460_04270 [Mycobacterium sp. 20KCMC460]GLB82349.1 hypothetical protein SRL2020028_16050 [Mycobacterium kiyosense]GLB88944.1 hypothetical protein SRL2020130_17610 [Mycobacterium kiyosense]GLB95564.1 hypothetical protein SRL2020226_23400 [Mycobacterium kiyosense]
MGSGGSAPTDATCRHTENLRAPGASLDRTAGRDKKGTGRGPKDRGLRFADNPPLRRLGR